MSSHAEAQPMSPLPDYYEILQVHPRASQAVIKKAYRTLLMELGHHPDRGGDPAVAARITEAYQVLGDPSRRAEYDRAYFGGARAGHPPPPRADEPAAAQAAARSSLVVLCPRCRTKNRVRSQEVLDIAKCSRCGQKLSHMPGFLAELADRLEGGLRRVVGPQAASSGGKDRPAARAAAVGVPLVLLAASAIAALWAFAGDPMVGDPILAARQLDEEQRYEEARHVLDRAIGRDPANPRLYEKLGDTFMRQKAYEEAAGQYELALRHNGDNANLWAAQGMAYYQAGKLADAERSLKQAVRIDPDFDPALFNLGNIHAKRQRLKEAISYYERALKVRPQADYYYNLGLVRRIDEQRQPAITAFKAALGADPNHRASMVQLAALYAEKGDYNLAAAQYLTASQLKHEDVDLHLKLADIYERTGQTGLAIREWNVCLEQGRDNPLIVERARRALTKLGAPPAS